MFHCHLLNAWRSLVGSEGTRCRLRLRVAVDDKVKAAPKEAPKEASTSASHPKDPKAKDQNTQRFWISTGQADSKGRGMVRDRKGMVRFKLTN